MKSQNSSRILALEETEPCGLADCQTRHKNGFVALTSSEGGAVHQVALNAGKRRWQSRL